ncbi:hypothetical protein M413DRAFT_14072 [Hebeloma cylindrosporum]|uniref:Uncharacterized protein n=1 Tax=Hebeloma cylindrosporum TaxID=76867 RepID=A0A0C2XE99_HEBCY|nr:hypothetical protein M413DRAFT_14072 [Hebeloma cylindrosporum h7]
MTPSTSPRPPVAHINATPPELLGEIFAYAAALDPDAPLTLSQVSRAFHRVVHMTPYAWTTLRLLCSQGPEEEWHAIRKAAHWFDRAGGCTINLCVEMGPRTSSGCIRARRTGEEPDFSSESTWEWALPRVLRDFQHRIQTLEIHSTTADEAQYFFNCLYPVEPLENAEDEWVQVPLQSFSLYTSQASGSNTSSHGSRSFPKHKYHPSSGPSFESFPSLSQPRFSRLAKVNLVNHYLPTISPFNLRNLSSLCITYPLRFTPIPIQTLLQVVQAAPQLEVLEVEARVVDLSPLPSSPSPVSPSTPTSSDTFTRSPPSRPSTPFESSITRIRPDAPLKHAEHHPNLITLPNLTHLSLRINNLPALLKHLLLPSLHTLRLDDLDGKRSGAAAQTGDVLRQLLVRMELPCEGTKRQGCGLKVLEMCGVALTPANANSHSSDSEDVWGWCFRRMRTLEELRVNKMDTNALLAMITPHMGCGDDVVLPNLQKLVVHEMGVSSRPSSPGPSSSPLLPSSPKLSSFLKIDATPFIRSSPPSGPILKFQMRRPEVDVIYSAPANPVRALPPNVDFLELYTRHSR